MIYPIADKQFLNVAAFVGDDQHRPEERKHAATATKEDFSRAFSDFGPTVQALIQILPNKMSRWAVFDTLDDPLSSFTKGRLVLAGDAAHGSSPHHGAGAGMGVEDAIMLAALIERVDGIIRSGGLDDSTLKCVAEALGIYDSVRRDRTQWLVASSRMQGQIVKGLQPEIGRDFEKLKTHTRSRLSQIQTYDWQTVLNDAVAELDHHYRN